MTLETTNLHADRRARIGRNIQSMLNKPSALTDEERERFNGFSAELRAIEQSIRKENEEKYARAFRNWMRYGLVAQPDRPEFPAAGSHRDQIYDMGITAAEREILESTQRTREREFRDMGVVSGGVLQSAFPGSQAGFFCPTGFAGQVENAMKSFSCMLETSTPMPTETGSVFPFPTSNDTSAIGEQVNEAAQVTDLDPLTGQIVFRSYKFSSRLVKVSLELLLDSGVELDAYFAQIFGWRLGRILNYSFTLGPGGTAGPQGIVGAVTRTVAAIGSTVNDGTGAGSNSIGSEDFAALENLLDPSYRPGAEWMMHPTTLATLRAALDKQGRVLWPGLHSGGRDTILNYGIRLNVNLPQLPGTASSPPATNTTALFGKFDKYTWRKCGPMLMYRLKDRFGDFAQRAFLLICRADGNLLDAGSHPVVGLTNSY
jgi:HK97 family phage major capsid protein